MVGVYLTFPDEAAAAEVARELVARRLAACVNVMPPGPSVYRWQGRVVEEREVVAWAKTTKEKVGELVSCLKELHPYELPCAVAYPAVDGSSEEYLAWVAQEVS